MSVFLANQNNKFDLSTLSPYGDTRFLVDGYMNPFNTDTCLRQLKEGLEYFDPEKDWLCLTGNMMLVSFMVMVAYEKFDTFKVLLFDSQHSNYRERVITHDS